tara:strand:- start:243 stop:701 length:459 start_codon:yes stop_codon:yes gene_type:complete
MEINKNLSKYHKTRVYYCWKRRGVKFTEEEFEFLYASYINTTECQLNIHINCSKTFKNTKDRHLDHDHKTGKPRAICCCKCNNISDRQIQKNNKSGHRHITTEIHSGKECWRISIPYNYKRIKRIKTKHLHSLESVIELRDSLYKKHNINIY